MALFAITCWDKPGALDERLEHRPDHVAYLKTQDHVIRVAGLCGLGDLVLTCSSPQSRNMSVGLALGSGKSLEEALAGKLSVAEGVASAPAVRALARQLNVEMPICEAVAAVLGGEITLNKAIDGLLSRPLKSER